MTLIWSAPAGAADCPTELTGVESDPWRAAVDDLGQIDFRETDCARLVIDVGLEETRLSFVTQDGREAVRTLRDPAELRPTVEALLVADSLTEAAAPAPPRPAPRATPKPVESNGSDVDPAVKRTPPASPRTGPAYALQLGARVGSRIADGSRDAILLSPVLVGSAWIDRYPWELGVLAALEFQYFDLRGHNSEERESSAVSVGVLVGRRDAQGSLDLLTSLRFSVATIENEAERGSGEARGGIAVGLATPSQRAFRLRADLCAELVAGSNITSPESPEWAVSTLVGVEIGGG